MIEFSIFYGDMYGFHIQVTNQIGITVIAAEPTSTDSFYIEKCHIGVSKEVLCACKRIGRFPILSRTAPW